MEEIRSEIDFEISRASWMDDKSKSYARNKLKALKIKIGYPEWYKEEEMFSNYYYGVRNINLFILHIFQKIYKNNNI